MTRPTTVAKLLSSAAVALTVMTACTPPGAPDGEWRPIDADGWRYGDLVVLNRDHDTIPGLDTLTVAVRHTANYGYSNLWLELRYYTSDTIAADTFDITLADDYGNWLGEGSGTAYQRMQRVRPSRPIREGSIMQLRHIMRVDTLREIEQIGLQY